MPARLVRGVLVVTLATLALAPLASGERASVVGQVSRVRGTTVEIAVEPGKGLKVGDEGVVSYESRVGGKAVETRIARVKVKSVGNGTATAEIVDSTEAVQRGYVVTFEVVVATPCLGSLLVQTTPPGASITVNDTPQTDPAPLLLEGLPCGEARVQAALAGYEAAEDRAKISRDGVAKLVLAMTRKSVGRLVLLAGVSGVEVWAGDRRLGEASPRYPLTADVAVGSSRLRAKKDGYRDWEREVSLRAGELMTVQIDLEPVGPARTIRGEDGAEMVLVVAGPFWMGSSDSEVESVTDTCRRLSNEESRCRDIFNREVPRRLVTLRAYYIDRLEVTNALFERFVRANGVQTSAERGGYGFAWQQKDRKWQAVRIDGATWRVPSGPGSAAIPDHPVVQVSWSDALSYCRWAGKRLPSEAEWEKAARGVDGQTYPWAGREWLPNRANGGQRVGATTRVGTYVEGASPFGVLDMAGNVGEWVNDWFDKDYYKRAPAHDSKGPDYGQSRVTRGGGWHNHALLLRTTTRLPALPESRANMVGFRCAKDAEAAR